ncbi:MULTISPECIES: NAD(P)H-hydrate epimerase [Haloferax]|uniref:NAD(P)H-hydrate epimerase n=1 Tax=Haloferax marinum TaxID=2666143 RepID=A0A6A8G936_9EURY|nr:MULTISPECIES: NAD(P)H-hydrate epimerase [Haloferax]KAB1197586.1 NAD(P)H-hydrate epimerase [Haloferax sp. CBA1150]MRW96636.1 NAD(P)H-hydrate epimerase [Haloferax marinum]
MTPQFETTAGVAVPAVTAEQMREVDRVAVDEIGLALLQMMEHAGRNLAEVAREVADGGRIVVLAGDGGNGGGGICAARHLANGGADVTLVLDRDADELTGAAARQRRVLAATDATIVSESDVGNAGEHLRDAAVVVDALVGYGLSGALRGTAATLVEATADAAHVVSLDVPSGVDATTGDAPGVAVDPDVSLTLALPKTGLAEAAVGDLLLADIGIPRGVYDTLGIDYTDPFAGARRVWLRNRT